MSDHEADRWLHVVHAGETMRGESDLVVDNDKLDVIWWLLENGVNESVTLTKKIDGSTYTYTITAGPGEETPVQIG